RSDLYSTGCLLFELLTGRPPFQGDSPVAIAYQHVGEAPPRPSAFNPKVSPALDAVVLHSLAKDREARYQDATAFRADLQAARLGRPISDAARGTALASSEATMAISGLAAGAATTIIPSGGYAGGPEPVHGNTATLPAIGHDPDDEPRKRRGLGYFLLVLGVLACLALLFLAGRSLLNQPSAAASKVSVPSVTNKPVETASAEIRAAGLAPQTHNVASSKAVGTVVDQSPPGGEQVARGSTVTLSVSSGPDTVTLPDLKGYSQDEAKTLLTSLGLKLGTTSQVDGTSVEMGKIITTDPAAGQSVPVGSAVNLKVSSGLVSVPDVTGKLRSDAATQLSDLGFTIKTTYVTSTQTEDTVLKQSPKANDKVPYGTTIVLTVAQPAPPTPTPTTTTTTPTPTTSTTATLPLPGISTTSTSTP
ncbi:MAG TPA: PASTA domain-containing protein, partial [Pedococcus sp.]|nr:PASTA domain-containing protein [Pedococcus sp.]